MPRVSMTVRVQPEYKTAIRQAARDLNRSDGYIVEEAVFAMLRDKIGHNHMPGMKLAGDDDHIEETDND